MFAVHDAADDLSLCLSSLIFGVGMLFALDSTLLWTPLFALLFVMTSLHHNVTVLMPLHVEQCRKETIQPQTREGNLVAKRVRSSGRRFRTAHSCVQMDLMDLPVYVVPACSCWLKLPLKWRRANYTSVLGGQLERQRAPNSCALRNGVGVGPFFHLRSPIVFAMPHCSSP